MISPSLEKEWKKGGQHKKKRKRRNTEIMIQRYRMCMRFKKWGKIDHDLGTWSQRDQYSIYGRFCGEGFVSQGRNSCFSSMRPWVIFPVLLAWSWKFALWDLSKLQKCPWSLVHYSEVCTGTTTYICDTQGTSKLSMQQHNTTQLQVTPDHHHNSKGKVDNDNNKGFI